MTKNEALRNVLSKIDGVKAALSKCKEQVSMAAAHAKPELPKNTTNTAGNALFKQPITPGNWHFDEETLLLNRIKAQESARVETLLNHYIDTRVFAPNRLHLCNHRFAGSTKAN